MQYLLRNVQMPVPKAKKGLRHFNLLAHSQGSHVDPGGDNPLQSEVRKYITFFFSTSKSSGLDPWKRPSRMTVCPWSKKCRELVETRELNWLKNSLCWSRNWSWSRSHACSKHVSFKNSYLFNRSIDFIMEHYAGANVIISPNKEEASYASKPFLTILIYKSLRNAYN